MKHIKIITTVTSTVLLIAFSGCYSNNSNGNVQSTNPPSAESTEYVEETPSPSSEAENQTEKASEMEGTTWFYDKSVDDLTNEVTSLNAYIISTNRVRIDSYGNTARMSITLTYSTSFSSNPSTFVMFSFVDDNKLCRLSDFQGSGLLAVFDNGDIDDRWTLIDMSKKRDALYMSHPSKVVPFVKKLKESKHARIQVNLEHVGKNTFDFNIEGLKWDFQN